MTDAAEVQEFEQEAGYRLVQGVNDVRVILDMARRVAEKSQAPFDAEIAWNTLSKAHWGMCAFVEDKAKPIGVVLGSAEYHWHNWNIYAREVFFYVEPEYRGRNINRRLLEYFTMWAKERGAVALKINGPKAVYGDKLPTFIKGMQRAGFRLESVVMSKEV